MTGAERIERAFTAGPVDLFRFSAATWNAHRIHYDEGWARSEGLPGLVVQAHLHGAWFAQVARDVAGPGARIRRLSWTNRRPVVAGQAVVISGEPRVQATGDIIVELREAVGDDTTAIAEATVVPWTGEGGSWTP